ncbi:MAG: photosynthetic reaction center subunit H [Parvularculaceae bacterium]|nr:photosynthetic reaction center subunit H [Parvularculaceae bacterium]
MFKGYLLPGVDLADIALWAFTLFFFGLIFYLRREDRREGYPLEADTSGKLEPSGTFWFARPKTFKLPHDKGTFTVPHGPRDTRQLALKRSEPWPGAPYIPTGDPMRDGVGPASYAERNDWPDLTVDGSARIVPLRVARDLHVATQDRDPRGFTVYGADNKPAGEVADLWVDRSESIIRYIEVKLANNGGTSLLPMTLARVEMERGRILVSSILASQFAGVPKTRMPDQVTRLEEDKICGYYGGGKLYATPARAEPLI